MLHHGEVRVVSAPAWRQVQDLPEVDTFKTGLCTERLALPFVRALMEVGRNPPAALGH